MASSSRNVTVNVIGDATGFSKAMGTAGSEAETTGHRISSAFRNSFGELSNAFGGALGPLQGMMSGVGDSVDSVFDKASSLGTKMAGVGAAGLGVGLLLSAAGSGDQAAQQQLSAAITATGGSYAQYKGVIDDTIKSQAKNGTTAGETMNAIQTLTTATGSAATATADMGNVANLAAAKHESLTEAATQYATILSGKGLKALAQAGITQAQVTAAVTASNGAMTKGQAAASLLAEKYQGQAAAAADTFDGKLKALKATIENSVATIGQKYGPAITAASAGMTVLGGAMDVTKAITDHFSEAGKAAAAVQEAENKAILEKSEALKAGNAETSLSVAGTEEASAANVELAGAAQVGAAGETELAVAGDAADASMLPMILTIGAVVAAAALLGIGIYELATHWKEVWGAMKAAVEDAWNFISGTVDDVVGFIKAHWQLLLAILTGPIGLAVLAIKDHFNDIVTFISNIPGEIAGFFSGIGSDFEHIGSEIVNGLISGIGSMASSLLSTIEHLIPGGGVIGKIAGAIGLASGGIVTAPTLAVVGEAGPEAVIPLTGGVNVAGLTGAVAPLVGGLGGSGAVASAGGGGGSVQQSIEITLDGQKVGAGIAQYLRSSLLAGPGRATARIGLS